jgi:hypothetical protein
LLLSCLIQILQTIKTISLEKLATALPLPVLFESRRKKIQRFLMLPHLGFKTVWFLILLSLIPTLFPNEDTLYFAFDRTNWRLTNLLVVSNRYERLRLRSDAGRLTMSQRILRGEIWLANLNPTQSSEQSGILIAIIVSPVDLRSP